MSLLMFKKFAPRWIIFFIDVFLIFLSFIFSYFLLHELSINSSSIVQLLPAALANLLVSLICILEFSTYKGIIRYSEMMDIIRIVKLALLQFGIWMFIFVADRNHLITGQISLDFFVINLFVVIFVLVSLRILVKEIYFRANPKSLSGERIMIFGAGHMGQITQKVLSQNPRMHSSLIGFIDDSSYKIGKEIEGMPIFDASAQKLERLLRQKAITHIFIAIDKFPVERKVEITDICGPLKIKVQVIPPYSQWTDGSFLQKQIKELNIQDLLERDEIHLPSNLLQDTYKSATVLVTGAAGSIGSEICRQLCKIQVGKIILLDHSESGLFDLKNELIEKFGKQLALTVEIASVRDKRRIKKVFFIHKPSFVFHAAAYKHVPLMETFPCEAILTNIYGTKNIAELSMQFQVKKFVLISTDKAVNPTNIMGATKRISELFVQELSDSQNSNTQFIITRFGNVLGSVGSVVPTFKKQIEMGGPITITHPEITRFFMTIPEASKLVLEAGKIGNSGDILLFDMGKPVKILDLAIRMIHLAGFKPYEDIDIVHTQLRPGEKMYEELFKDTEKFIETDHPRILKAKKIASTPPGFSSLLDDLEIDANLHNDDSIIFILNKLLPDFNPYLYKNSLDEQPINLSSKLNDNI